MHTNGVHLSTLEDIFPHSAGAPLSPQDRCP